MLNTERTLRDENAKRKQQRIVQVREQSKEIAAKLRKRINEERERQKDHIEQVKIDELRKWRNSRLDQQQRKYENVIASTLDANQQAHRELEANFLHQQRKQELDLIAAQRGRTALRKELDCRVKVKPVRKPRSKSIDVQTDHVSFARSRSQENEAPKRCHLILPPESANHDGELPVISDRSVDILEKSKRFVEDASRRLDEISAKVASCQEADTSRSCSAPDSARIVVQTQPKRRPISEAVRTNNATQLRVSLNRQPQLQEKRVPNRPKRLIPSAIERVPPPVPERNSVVCYDHPNRFTKTYDIPKNIVVKTLNHGEEDDAVTNALNETLTQIEEDAIRKARSKDLSQKEAIRQLEALEKSQIRRDYEMLAKTLEEVRKSRSMSPKMSRGLISGDISMARSSSTQHLPVGAAAVALQEELRHIPIRLSCPMVDSFNGKSQLNVADREELSGSDSAQTILLDQLALESEQNTIKSRQVNQRPEVVIETKTNLQNVKVRAIKEGGTGNNGEEPMKIIIQLESADMPHPKQIDNLVKYNYGATDESLSTNYMSPPSEINLQINNNRVGKGKLEKIGKCAPRSRNTSHLNLKEFIKKLLQMPQTEIENLSENDVSDFMTPSNSIINVNSNKLYDDQKLSNVSRIIEDNYSILEEVNQLIAAQDEDKPKSRSKSVGSETTASGDSILQRYATMSQNYNDRIQSLNKMIKVIRAEKENLLFDNGVSNISMSERDTSTKYKDFASHSAARASTSNGSELSNDSGETEAQRQLKQGSSKVVRLEANKIIGLSRDSGISMSRPATSAEVQDNVDDFEPILKDIPKHRHSDNIVSETGKKRPPNSISRYSPEAVQAAGHDLSTIIEVDTPGTGQVQSVQVMAPEVRRFPTIEEFVLENAPNVVSMLSDADRAEVRPAKSFVSFKKFLDTNRMPAGDNVTQSDLELNLSEIAEELRRRSLLVNEDNNRSNNQPDNEEKSYLQSLSKELEEMIQRINSQGLKEPAGTSMISCMSQNSDNDHANDTTIGRMVDRIQPKKFPTREQFNLRNNSEHHKSTDVLNLSNDLMNALENNLSEMGLKWAVNMLKRSHQQISSSSSRGASSSEENQSKEPIPFESKTMSLLTDLEKSSISDESKTSNINMILRELIRNRSNKSSSSSNGSLSSTKLEGRLSNGNDSTDGRCLRTSTPVTSNVNSITLSTIADRERTALADISEGMLFSGESKLSSVKDSTTLSNHGLNIPETQLNTDKYNMESTRSTQYSYSRNENNKRKMTRRTKN